MCECLNFGNLHAGLIGVSNYVCVMYILYYIICVASTGHGQSSNLQKACNLTMNKITKSIK